MAEYRNWNKRQLDRQGTRKWEPQTGVEESQGRPSMRPGELENLQIPRDPGLTSPGFINPYTMTFYGPVATLTTGPTTVLQANQRRTYLLLQNQGPGNLWINFGADAVAPTVANNANCLQLVTTQALEQIGGGFVVALSGQCIPACFVSADYISAISDTVGTTILCGEGIARFSV